MADRVNFLSLCIHVFMYSTNFKKLTSYEYDITINFVRFNQNVSKRNHNHNKSMECLTCEFIKDFWVPKQQ